MDGLKTGRAQAVLDVVSRDLAPSRIEVRPTPLRVSCKYHFSQVFDKVFVSGFARQQRCMLIPQPDGSVVDCGAQLLQLCGALRWRKSFSEFLIERAYEFRGLF